MIGRDLICPNCSTENTAGSKFCRECAAPLSAGCPNCGFVNLPNSKFCSECATPLSAPAPASARSTTTVPASVAERRLVSILFADLVGFTPFAEERDSEDVRETLTRYFDLTSEVVERYGGTVEKFIGDAVMAVWGAPTAHEDDAERAVRAALELVDAVTALGPTIQARAAVLTGEAAVTLGATNQGLVAGDLVNTASRLQSVAPPGAVLVGDQTQLAASAAIAFERVDDQILKGKTSPVPAWRALRVVAEVGGRNRSEGLEAPFVGRSEEMRFLKELLHAAGREKRVRVASVVGPAGIGKSRLAWELLKYIDGITEDVYWHSGRSPAYGEGISFWALGEMVRERCGLRELDDEEATRERVAVTVAEFVANPDERSWIEGALLTLLGVESGTAADQLFGAWRTFFERISDKGTVVLIFEDMHFADTGLIDFVDHMLDWSRGLPLYIITLARPDLIEKRPNWGAGKRNFNSLYLEPLPDDDMRQLLAGLVPGLPEAAAARIVSRADGIPLYAVETVRTLVAEGKLVNEDGVYVPKGDLTSLSVPTTLTALISSRLDALDEVDRRIVHDGSVLGQSFTLAALAALAGMSEAELEPRLVGLARRELLQREMDARSPELGQYAFVQALIREVAYNTLSKHDRKRLHVAAARFFESLGNDEIAGVLASHYLAAHANAAEGAEAEALAAQARLALKAAAARASTLGGFGQAMMFLEQALSVTNDEAERFDLLFKAGDAARPAGQFERAAEFFKAALAVARDRGDRTSEARATAALGWIMVIAFQSEEAEALLEPALSEFADVEEAVLAEMRTVAGRARSNRGDPRGALELLESALETAEKRGLMVIVANAFVAKSVVLFALGRRQEGAAIGELAARLAAANGLTEIELRAIGNLAIEQSDVEASAGLAAFEEAIGLARRAGLRSLMFNNIANYGWQAFVAGKWDAAVQVMSEALLEDAPGRGRILILSNILLIQVSRGESIVEGLAEMERLGEQMSGPEKESLLNDVKAHAAMAHGDLEAARDFFMKEASLDGYAHEYLSRAGRAALWAGDVGDATALLTQLDDIGSVVPMAKARRATLAAGVAAAEGRTAEALSLYRDALARLRDIHVLWDEALTGLDMAKLLDPEQPEVAAIVASTRSIMEELRAKPYLEMLDAALARGSAAPPETASQPRRVAVSR